MRMDKTENCRLPLILLATLLLSGCIVSAPAYHERVRRPLPPIPEQNISPETPPPDQSPPSVSELSSSLTVEDAVLLSLQNNTDLQVQRLTPAIAAGSQELERGVFDPQLVVSGQYEKSDDYDTATSAIDMEKTASVIGGISRTLTTGTTVDVNLRHQRTTGAGDEEQQAELSLNVTQALLRGFSSAVNLVRVHQADLNTIASLYELQGYAETLVADTEIAYWQYVLANEKIAIYTESYELVKKAREEIELRIQVGLLPEMEAAAAQAEEASRVQALVEARSQLETRRLQLLRLISPLGDGFDLRITSISEPGLPSLPITDLEDRIILAEQNRADLNEARLRLRQNRLETLATRNGLLPRLDFFMRLGKTGYSDSFGEAWQDLDGDGYNFSSGLTLSHYLGNRQAKARDITARAAALQATKAVENLRQLIRFEVRLAINEVERSRQLIGASSVTRSYQEASLRAETERFAVGSSTAIVVAQAQRDLLQSQIAEIEARINYRIGLLKLYQAEGSLLQRRGVIVQSAPSLDT